MPFCCIDLAAIKKDTLLLHSLITIKGSTNLNLQLVFLYLFFSDIIVVLTWLA